MTLATTTTQGATRRAGATARWHGWAVAALLCLPLGAAAQTPVMADLSSHTIEIDTRFIGTDVVLFGAADGPTDIAVVIRGPRESFVVREKTNVGGIWVNAAGIEFTDAPGFYAVLSTGALSDMLPATILDRHEIGTNRLQLGPSAAALAERTPGEIDRHRRALLETMQRSDLYLAEPGAVSFLGGRLFRADVRFPANVPTGAYKVDVYTLHEGNVIGAQSIPLIIRKVGLEADLFDFANGSPVLYGIVAVLVAIAAGFLPRLFGGRT